jgi:L-ascorbate 6-phosphate lactonase
MKKMSMKQIKAHRVPPGCVMIWWLGQAGFIVKTPKGIIAALDPFLSNSCKAIGEQDGFRMDRQVPPPLPPKDLAGIDLYLITHSHQGSS